MQKVAIVGIGNIAKTYLEILPNFKDIKIDALVDIDSKVLKNQNAKTYLQVSAMLQDGVSPDIAIVCTPPNSHFKTIVELLEAGVNCLVEKPLVADVEEAKNLIKVANAHKCSLVVSRKYNFSIPLQEAKKLIQTGQIGDILSIENIFSGPYSAKNSWRSDAKISGGGVWIDNGPHSLDIIQMLGGDIEKIKMVESSHLQNLTVEDQVQVEAIHSMGTRSHITLSWNNRIEAPIIFVKGSKGEIVINWHETVIKTKGFEERKNNPYSKLDAFSKMLQSFIQSCKLKQNDDLGMKNVKWIMAGYKSLQSKNWESIL